MKKTAINASKLSTAIQHGIEEMLEESCEGFELQLGHSQGMTYRLVAEPAADTSVIEYVVLEGERYRCIEDQEPVKTIYLDLETTGLRADQGDEVLEIAIIDDEGFTLVHSLVRPLHKTEWPEAQAVNNITPDMVANAPTLEELAPQIQAAFKGTRVVIYNAAYDIEFLKPALGELKEGEDFQLHCAMRRFSVVRGVWDGRVVHGGNYKRWKQVQAAEYVGHDWKGAAHRALEDAWACRSIWRWTLDQLQDLREAPPTPASIRTLLEDAWAQSVPLTSPYFEKFMEAVAALQQDMKVVRS